MIYDLGEHKVTIKDDNFFIAPNSAVIGKVSLGSNISIWFNVVIRADNDEILIGDGCNIQDNSVLHVDEGSPVRLGDNISIGHSATIHGCKIGSDTLIGMGTTILSNASIGNNCLVGANSLITENKIFPDNSLIVGAPAKIIRKISEEELEHIKWNAKNYIARSKFYKKNLINK